LRAATPRQALGKGCTRPLMRCAPRGRHVLDVHRQATAAGEGDGEEARAEAFLKRYLEYARARVAPRLSAQAAQGLAGEYVELRQQARALLGPPARSPCQVSLAGSPLPGRLLPRGAMLTTRKCVELQQQARAPPPCLVGHCAAPGHDAPRAQGRP